jgi:SAM-dependent methyltransferase
MSEDSLTFTGERFLPDCEREIWYEHYHRYAMARHWVKGKDVLDAACGEGYGSHLLALNAHSVIGVDIDAQAVRHAEKTYPQDNLTFIQSDVLKLPLADNLFDVVVSFETLEHLAEHQELLNEFKRVLKPDGLILISTPDKHEYSDKTGFKNEYHVRELYRDEFESLLSGHFKHHQLYGQKLMFLSSIWHMEHSPVRQQHDHMTSDGLVEEPAFNPMYYVAVASDQPLTSAPPADVYHFTEEDETVYGHYHAVIRAHIAAEQALLKLEKQHNRWLSQPILGRLIKWFGKQ